MLTLWLFVTFALCLATCADYARPYAPLLRLRAAPACVRCGRRGWRMAT